MNNIFKTLLLTLSFCYASTTLFAQQQEDKTVENRIRLNIAPLIGTDIGGAIPIPISSVGNQMQAFPKLHLSLGAKLLFPIDPTWALAAEVIYKQVEMEANAYVENQKATLGETVQYFTGTVKTSMDFSMIEVPIYVRYRFGQSKNYLTLGGYGAWCGKADFSNNPQKGYIGNRPNFVGDVITEQTELTNMNFSSMLSRWDAGALIGYEHRILPRLALSFRFSMGFKDIFSDEKPLDYKMLQLRGFASVSYDLFSIKSRKH